MILKRKRDQYRWIWLSKWEKCEEKLLRLEILEHKNDFHYGSYILSSSSSAFSIGTNSHIMIRIKMILFYINLKD